MVKKVKVSQQVVLDRIDAAIATAKQQPQISTFGIKLLLEDVLGKDTAGPKDRTGPPVYNDIKSFYANVCLCIDRRESDKGPNQQAVVGTLTSIRDRYRT